MRRLLISLWIIAFSLCGCDQALRNILSLSSTSSSGGTTSPIANFSWIGGTYTPQWGWLTGHSFYPYNYSPAYFGGNTAIALDSVNGFIYATNGFDIVMKFNLSTGTFVGLIGRIYGSYGTCPQLGAASGWCTGGVATGGNRDGEFSSIASIAVDSTNGFLYVVDQNNYRIQKFNLSTGAFVGAIGVTSASTGTCPASGTTTGWCTGGTFVAGSGDGSFSFNTFSIAVDPTNDAMYVGQYSRLDKFTLSTGVFVGSVGKTSASTGTCPASGFATSWCTGGTFVVANADGGYWDFGQMAVDAANNLLYINQPNYHKVSKITLSTGASIAAIGVTSSSTGTCPASGPATGWCTGGLFTTNASDGGFGRVGGLVVDSANDLMYVGDTSNGRIDKIVLSTGAFVGSVGKLSSTTGTCPSSGAAPSWCTWGNFTQASEDGGYNNPYMMALDSAHSHLLTGDFYRVAALNLSTGAFVAAMGTPTSGEATASTWTKANENLVPNQGAGDGQFDYATDVAVDSVNGFFYVLDGNNSRVEKFDLTSGAFIGAIGNVIASTGTCPNSGATNGWCTGGDFQSGSGDGMLDYPQQFALDVAHDALYVADQSNGRVQKFVASTGAVIGSIGKTVASTGTCPASGTAPGWCTGGDFSPGRTDGQYYWVVSISVDPINGFIYVGDSSDKVSKVNASTGAFVGAIGATNATSGTCPASGVASGWCTGGSFTSGSVDGAFRSLQGMGIDPINGFLYVGDGFNGNIQKFNLSTGAFVGAIGLLSATSGTCPSSGAAPGWCTGGTFYSGNGDGAFNSMGGSFAIDVANNALYIADGSDIRVQKINLSTGAAIGSIGFATSTTGTCSLGGNATWCTGGSFNIGAYVDGSFENPMGVSIDSSGHLYIVDDNRVVRMTP